MNKPCLPDFLHAIRIVLVKPSHPGNIGSVARAMKTMGLSTLYLVQPKAFPHAEADTLASGAVDVLRQAKVVDSVSEALAQTYFAVALTSRPRELTSLPLTPREIAPELILRARTLGSVALVFGNETFGLSIADVTLCHRVVSIAGNPDYCSLNLAMAVQVMSYELFTHLECDDDAAKSPPASVASCSQVEGLCAHLDQTMRQIGYYERRNGERLMRRMHALFQRCDVLPEEIDILRGFLKAVGRLMQETSKRC